MPPASDDAASAPDSSSDTPEICSGCQKQAPTGAMDTSIHLHHVHLHAANRERSASFYEQFFDARRVTLNGVSDAWLTTPTMLLIDEVDPAPRSDLPTALQHLGWGASDPAAWYQAAHQRGVAPDTRGNTLFNTQETPTVGAPGSGSSTFALLGVQPPACYRTSDAFSYMYVLGPDQERIEVWSGEDKRVNHIHFTTANLASAVRWYERFFGVTGTSNPVLFYAFFLDDILFFIEPIGEPSSYDKSDDHVLSHIAFSVGDLAAWQQRARAQNIEVVAPPAPVQGFMSFFVRGPDGVLIELVQAQPASELCPAPK